MKQELYPCQRKMFEVCEKRIFDINSVDYTVEYQIRSRCFVLNKIMKSSIKLDYQIAINDTCIDEKLKEGLIGICECECPYNKG